MCWTKPTASIVVLTTCLFVSPAAQSTELSKVKPLLGQAELCEQQFDWDKACETYETIFRLERNVPELRQRYLHALRRSWQARRLRDPSFRKEVLSLEYGQVLRLFGVIQDSLLNHSLDRKNVDPGQLLRKGIEELSWALNDPYFCQQNMPSHKVGDARHFRDFMVRTWGQPGNLNRAQVLKHVREITLAAQNRLQLPAAVAVMEIACGACYAFDDYTVYLTPSQLRELYDSLKGEYVGVGVTLGTQGTKVVIAEVAAFSPAAEAMLNKDDQVLNIDKKAVAHLALEAAVDLLEGPVGSSVELDVYTPGMGMRTITLRRRALFVPSVTAHMKTEVVGYMHIACFQDTTLQEVDEALVGLVKSDMKALVLDLRGNTGGLFEVAVEVARRFLANGIVVSTQNEDTRLSTIYHSRNPGALGVPLVVLVDGDTASSAEVLAGALRDNKRGRLVGQTTFGKGCTQSILKLPAGAGGIPAGGLRITVARFYSPEGLPYTGRGVTPHMFVERMLMADAMNMMDHQIEEAILEAQRAVQ